MHDVEDRPPAAGTQARPTADTDAGPGTPLLSWIAGAPCLRGSPIGARDVRVGRHGFRLAAVDDAADLLEDAFFAHRFVAHDLAPYGAELWPASIMLAETILGEPYGADRRAIELGAGLGLVSIAAARHGWRMTVTDHDETALRFARYNASLNDVALPALSILDWHRPSIAARFARVFAADVLYQLTDHESLLRCVRSLLASDGVALIADPGRGVADRFAERAREAGFDVSVQSAAAPNHAGRTIDGRIFRLRIPRGAGGC